MRKLLLTLGVASIFLVNVACFNDYDVLISDFKFTPADSTGGDQQDTVTWTNNGDEAHTSTSTIGLWDSGSITGGGAGTFTRDFFEAGKFAYVCTIHPDMKGTISVPTFAFPQAGQVGDNFNIVWASHPEECCGETPEIPSGFNADVQIKKPGKSFKDWQTNQTGTDTSETFVPDKKGKYQFRARLQNDSTGKASKYSPTATIYVDP